MQRQRNPRGEIELPVPAGGFLPLVGGHPALDFVNTVDRVAGHAPHDELFPGYGNVVSWTRHAGLIDAAGAQVALRQAKREPREAVAVRRRAVELRDALFALFTRDRADANALALLTREWQAALDHQVLSLDATGTIRLEATDGDRLDAMLGEIALAAVALLTGLQRARVRMCAAPECGLLFLDTTRNGSRRFCRATGCGTRERVRRFREAQREQAGA